MQKLIIADTSCLILLEKINQIALLQKLFGEIKITSIIADEFGNPLPEWIKIVDPVNTQYQLILQAVLDKGEAIALAVEQKEPLLILDDMKARKMAQGLNLNFTGTLGILAEAKLSGHINSLKKIIEKAEKENFRLTKELKSIY